MKNLKKVALGGAMLAALAGSLASCSSAKTGEAYGLTHGAGYVSCATITMNGKKVTEATLHEVCFPTYVVSKEATAETTANEVTDHGSKVTKNFYTTFSYGSTTYTYDVAKSDYVSGGKTFVENMAVEANAKAYYDAVMADAIEVGSSKSKSIMTKAALSKDDNGYWGGDNYKAKLEGLGATGYTSVWKYYRDMTCKFVVENGVDSLLATTQNDDKVWTNGAASTGTTWSDLNSNKDGYFSYAKLFQAAANNIK